MSARIIRRQIPIAMTFIFGMIITADWYIKWDPLQSFTSTLLNYQIIIIAVMMGFAAFNLLITHGLKIRRSLTKNDLFEAFASSLVIITMVLWAIVGIVLGNNSPTYQWLFNTFNTPLSSTAYAMTLFFMASATYRLLRTRNKEATIFLLVTLFTIIANSPYFASLAPGLVTARSWIEGVVVKATYRAITMGVGLGAIMMALRTMLAMETGYLGRTVD